MEKSNEAPRRAKVLRTDEEYLAKLRYGYLTVTVAILSFVGLLVMNYLLLDNALYIKILVIYAKAYRGFIIRTILIIIATMYTGSDLSTKCSDQASQIDRFLFH